MSELVEFLLARLAEDEAVARSAEPVGWVTFRQADGSMDHTAVAAWTDEGWLVDGRMVQDDSAETFYDPARVLAEVEAKRRVIARYSNASPDGDEWAEVAWDFLLAFALPYADHPDFREEWRS